MAIINLIKFNIFYSIFDTNMNIERITIILLMLLFCMWSGAVLCKLYFTSMDELYSVYRNTIDLSPRDFRHRLAVKRTVAGIAFALSLSMMFFFTFSD